MKKVKILIYNLILICSIILPLLSTAGEYTDKEIIKAIKRGRVEVIKEVLGQQNKDPEASYGRKEAPLLYYAIRYKKPRIAHLLLQYNADPNYKFREQGMLLWAARYNSREVARLLLDYGARINQTDKHGHTPLMRATWMNLYDMLDLLVEYGADVYKEDKNGKSALNYAYYNGEKSTGRFFERILKQRTFDKAIPGYHDGPFVKWLDDSTAKVTYTWYDPYDSTAKRVDSIFSAPNHEFSFKGFVFDTNIYHVNNVMPDTQNIFKAVDKVFVLNDIHGHFDRFIQILTESGIIDKNHRWTFGEGHLVLNGDIVDRGNKVTETLWFIYQLEKDARKAGGKVHFLLGNHELMIMQGQTVYMSDKSRYFRNFFDWNYSQFFSKSTFLGEWLRAHNSIIKINNSLFVHGGISYDFYQHHLGIDQINDKVREKLNNENCTCDEIFSKSGPFWYRGYIWEGEGFTRITEEQLTEVLNFYEVERIIVGHTIVEQIQLLYNNRVIAISVPFHDKEDECHGLMIKNNRFFEMRDNAKPQLLF